MASRKILLPVVIEKHLENVCVAFPEINLGVGLQVETNIDFSSPWLMQLL